ncbi:MAG TPA: glycosyltransferase family 4 protein [Candidatus Saccharimonadales bacterium]|jgi:colanic acid biosynthesis glycosyl transferase WcaI|nr:glycosyltransferase family 4 protein [Candidatus Saccharimonadales bacterium]
MHREISQIANFGSDTVGFVYPAEADRNLEQPLAKFLIITQYFPPEIGGAPTRLQSVATELRKMGHEVEVLTGFPNYPHGKFPPGYRGSLYKREEKNGVTIHRVWLYPATGSGTKRMANYGSFTLMTFFGLFKTKRPDYIFVESPPIFLSVPAYLAGILWRVPFIFNVSDMWPDVIVEGGFLKEGFLVKCMRAIESWSYRKATYVNAVTDGVRSDLLTKKSVPAEKLLFLPNGADTVRFQPRSPDTSLKEKLGLTGKKIFLWAGTLGLAHGIEHILKAAKLLEGSSDIHFLFVGDGSAKEKLVRLRENLNLRNVTFHDAVQLDVLPAYFSIADVGLASLIDLPLFDGARPSKLFPILASGKPLIFAGKGESARLVRDANAGIVVAPENSEVLARAVLELAQNPDLAQAYGRNGREYVETHLQWSQVIAEWLRQFRSLKQSSI